MDQQLYDEFGNYIGPEIDDEEDEEEEDEDLELYNDRADISADTLALALADTQAPDISVPHEEKKYYPEASELYGDTVETLVQDEDTQPITEPIIAPIKTKNFDVVERELPNTSFTYDFLSQLMFKPNLIRQICFLGHLHSGKTTLIDILVKDTHHMEEGQWKKIHNKYMDNRKDEIERGLSIKANPISLILSGDADKSYLFNVMDTPGHVNFQDEAVAAIRMSDAAVIVVDALNGVMCNTEKLLQCALSERLSIVVIINCIDRLILELKLPPTDAYFKLKHTIDELNQVTSEYCEALSLPNVHFSPSKGNVAFASGQYGFIFTIESFCEKYQKQHLQQTRNLRGGWMRGLETEFDMEIFKKCMWGDIWYNKHTKQFTTNPNSEVPMESESTDASMEGSATINRTFVEFILNPIYKIFGHTVGEQEEVILDALKLTECKKNLTHTQATKFILHSICKEFFKNTISSFVNMVINYTLSPQQNALQKISNIYNGYSTSSNKILDSIATADKNGPLIIHVVKSYHRPDCTDFDVLGRIFSGTVYKGQKVKILGETYSTNDTEDLEIREITHLWIYQAGRYRVEVSHVPAGNWVLMGGLSYCITKTATITNFNSYDPATNTFIQECQDHDIEAFKPLKFRAKPVIRVSCEPLHPSELPKMLEGFRRVNRAYPICETKVEESGEHVIFGTGELFLDCVLHDLRVLYGDLEVKVADPVTQFCETCVEVSALSSYASSANGKNTLHMSVEPLEKGIAEEIEFGTLKFPSPLNSNEEKKQLEAKLMKTLETKYNWDILAARSVWAFGPTNEDGTNILIDDTIPTEVDKAQLNTVKSLIVQGFQWVTREGPLIEENVRNCKFRLINAEISSDPVSKGGGQIIPCARRVAYSAFLLATPRLMEPVLFVEIECPADCVSAIYTVLAKRRGHVSKDMPKPGTPLYIVHAYIPAIESFGFETDLRTHTSGQAFCLSLFDHWALVPGDPLDKSILLRALEPAPTPHLAREFLLKTRRRKGLSENVAIHKFFDNPELAQMAKEAADFDDYFE